MNLLLLITLLLASCGEPLGRANPGAKIPYHVVGFWQLQDIAAKRGVQQSINGMCTIDGTHSSIYEAKGTHPYVAVHEFCHLSDVYGSYREAYLALQPSGIPEPHMLDRLLRMSRAMALADKLGGTTLDLWRACALLYGVESVDSHPEIMIKGQAFSQSLFLPFVPRAGSSSP